MGRFRAVSAAESSLGSANSTSQQPCPSQIQQQFLSQIDSGPASSTETVLHTTPNTTTGTDLTRKPWFCSSFSRKSRLTQRPTAVPTFKHRRRFRNKDSAKDPYTNLVLLFKTDTTAPVRQAESPWIKSYSNLRVLQMDHSIVARASTTDFSTKFHSPLAGSLWFEPTLTC